MDKSNAADAAQAGTSSAPAADGGYPLPDNPDETAPGTLGVQSTQGTLGVQSTQGALADNGGGAAPPTADEAEGEGEREQRRKRSAQARIGHLTREKRELERAVAQLRAAAAPPSAAEADTPLHPGNFRSYDDYIVAKAGREAENKILQRLQAVQQLGEYASAAAAKAAHESRVDEARGRYADFDAVALNDSIAISESMARAIVESEQGPDLAYYLGKNPGEAERIAGLNPISAVREIGRIEARLLARPAGKVTAAPHPPRTVHGGSSPTGDPDRLSIEDWIRRRNLEIRRRRSG